MPEGKDDDNNVDHADVDSLVVGVEQMNVQHRHDDFTNWRRSNIEGISGDSTVIEEARAASMPEPDDDDIPDEDDESDDTYIVDGVVAPVESHGGDDDDDFFV
uniref:Uncharacterized protein n=1 Tax=Oryza glaberrima TaxID=4538 RepID=I1PJN9_ORYGL